ncbi:MAG: BatA domain-containing protein [Chryseolinea sp.]
MGFTTPIWLWGLLGLMVPIGIHLLSRRENRIIKLGSIRHLDNSITQQALTIRLNEWILLALRCALIGSVILFLSEFHTNAKKNKENWLVIESGMERDIALKTLIDSLTRDGFEIKELRSGFPAASSTQADSSINYWHLVESIGNGGVESAVVLSYNRATGFRGKRVALPSNVTWIAKEPEPAKFQLQKVLYKDDSIAIRSGNSKRNETSFVDEVIPSDPPGNSISPVRPDTISITIVKDETYDHDINIFLAALNAGSNNRFVRVIYNITSPDKLSASEDGSWTIWFSESPLPAKKSSNMIYLSVKADPNSPLFVESIGCYPGKECWAITKRLNSETALEHQLPVELFSLLTRSTKEKYKHALMVKDQRVLPEKMNWSDVASASIAPQPPNHQPDNWVIWVVLCLLFAERVVAFKRNQ